MHKQSTVFVVIKQGRNMRVLRKGISILIFINMFFSFLLNHLYSEENSAEQLKVLWEIEFDIGEENECYPLAQVLNKTDNVLNIIAGSYIKSENIRDRVSGKFWHWGIDTEKGKEAKRSVINEISDVRKTIFIGATTLENSYLTSEGDIYALGEFEGREQALIKITKEGKIIFIKSVSEIFSGKRMLMLIKKMLLLPNGNFLLIGHEMGKGVVVEVDKDGKIIWGKTYELGNVGELTDGILINNKGDFLIAGWAIEDPSVFSNPEVRMMWCDSKGNLLSEEIFPGAFAKLCQLGSGEIVALYADNIDPQSVLLGTKDYKIRIYTPQYMMLLEKQIFKGHFIYSSLKIKPFSTQDFIVGGCKEIEPGKMSARMDGYNKKGDKLFTWIQKQSFCFKFLLTSHRNKLFVVTQKMLMRKEKKLYPLIVNVKCIEVRD